VKKTFVKPISFLLRFFLPFIIGDDRSGPVHDAAFPLDSWLAEFVDPDRFRL